MWAGVWELHWQYSPWHSGLIPPSAICLGCCVTSDKTLPLLTSGSASEHQDRTDSQEWGSHAVWGSE